MKTEVHLLITVGFFLTVFGSASFGADLSKTAAAQTQLGRFVDNGNGTVTDARTDLMWAAQDNGSDITWDGAKEYCMDYTGGGYSDWRMPTIAELMSLYDNSHSRLGKCNLERRIHITPLIDLSCFYVWSSEQKGLSDTRSFTFGSGSTSYLGDFWDNRSRSCWHRALPVRSIKPTPTKSWRLIDNGDGTVMDTLTGLMWAARDNGNDITWDEARRYCENFKGGGHTDWRMPTATELGNLYDMSYSLVSECAKEHDIHLDPLIHISCYDVWCSASGGAPDPWKFSFTDGFDTWSVRSLSFEMRALPVRLSSVLGREP